MNSTGRTLPLPKKARRRFLLLCLLAAAAAFLLFETASAQEGAEYQYVDLVMTYEYSNSIDVYYSVRNAGTQSATGVAVSFLLEDLQTNNFDLLRIAAPPTITGKKTVDQTNQIFTWEIGTLSPGETSRTLSFATLGHSGLTRAPEDQDLIGVITATASSHQPEPDFLSANNVAKFYSFVTGGGSISKHMQQNQLALLLSVDDLRPDAGGNVDFDLTAHQLSGGSSIAYHVVDDIEIRVELSEGTGVQVHKGLDSARWIYDGRPIGNLETG